MQHASPKIDAAWPYLLQSGGSTAGQQREQMEFTADWIIDNGQLDKPTFHIASAHTCIATLLFVPVNCVRRVVGG